MLSLLLLIAIQDVDLLRRLGSERAEEREAAGRALLELGPDARPLLERGARDPDLEIAGRARDLLAALDRRLEYFAHVLEKLRKDASPQRLLRDATQALRERCRDLGWLEIKAVLTKSFPLISSSRNQFGTTWRFLAGEGALVSAAGLRHDLILELETSLETSKTEPTKHILRQAKAVLLWKGKTDVAAIEAKPYPEGLFRGIFSQPLFRVDLGPYPILEELEVTYQHLANRWKEHNPWGFLVVARLANLDRTAGKTFIFHVPSGLDPLQDHAGRNAPGPFAAADTLGEWKTSGGGEWTSGKREFTTLRRVEPRRVSRPPWEGEVAYGPGDLKGLKDGTTSLALEGESFGDEDVAALARFAKLRTLRIGDTPSITAAGCAILPRLPELEELDLGCRGVDDETLRVISTCRRLKSLSISFSDGLSDAGVAHLAALKGLSDLRLHWAEGLTDESLRHLAEMPGLRTLRLWGARKLTDVALGHLSKLSGLEDLTLSHSTSWTASGMAKLESLRSLRVLTLGYAPVGDETLKTLGRLPALEEIWLRGLKVTDAGLLDLKGLTKLRFLHLDGCKKTSSEGLRALRAALPGEYVLE